MQINKRFLRVKAIISNTLPYLGGAIILFVYIGTAVLMSHLLALRMNGNYWLAGLVGFGVSFTRMFIVFQSQMGLEQLSRKFDPGAIMAVFLTAYTVLECYFLEPDLFISITGLILSGLIVEVIYLSRLNQVSRQNIFSDKKKMKYLKDIHTSEREYWNMIEEINDEKLEIPEREVSPVEEKNGSLNGVYS